MTLKVMAQVKSYDAIRYTCMPILSGCFLLVLLDNKLGPTEDNY